jgi:hypothetical protein
VWLVNIPSTDDIGAGKINGGVTLLLRHAERYPFSGDDGILTAKGVNL